MLATAVKHEWEKKSPVLSFEVNGSVLQSDRSNGKDRLVNVFSIHIDTSPPTIDELPIEFDFVERGKRGRCGNMRHFHRESNPCRGELRGSLLPSACKEGRV